MKIVLDTNVLISGFLTPGISRNVLGHVLGQKFCILSPYILDEFRSKLLSDKFHFPEGVVQSFVAHLESHASLITEEAHPGIQCPDPADRKILALCMTVKADLLITGDKELLNMNSIAATPIINPSQYWKFIQTP